MKALMVRTDFSLGESALKASRVAKAAKELGKVRISRSFLPKLTR
ncbi:putative DNA polymerase III alpha subunit [Klebsiella pneumoniae]|nr:putative DNA polymerase III alpha subunit [Klebsiella pneumoniae]